MGRQAVEPSSRGKFSRVKRNSGVGSAVVAGASVTGISVLAVSAAGVCVEEIGVCVEITGVAVEEGGTDGAVSHPVSSSAASSRQSAAVQICFILIPPKRLTDMVSVVYWTPHFVISSRKISKTRCQRGEDLIYWKPR